MRLPALCLALLLAGVRVAAAQPSVPPPDLTSPPADATRSSTGLTSKMLSPGPFPDKPIATDIVTVHYTGWAADGRMFDSSVARGNPSTFPLDRVMAGWRECVQLMTRGEKRRCWVPQDLAYRGAAGRPTGTVVFDIELLDVRPSPLIAPADLKQPPNDAHRMPSGLVYKVLRPGTGQRKPDQFSRVTVHYTGWTQDGKMFDSTITRGTPATLGLQDVIRGWTEGIPTMVEGERTRFWIPETIAYKGEAGMPRGMLVFDVELISVQ